MAHRTTLEEERPAKTPKAAKKPVAGGLAKAAGNEERERVFDAFRRWGYILCICKSRSAAAGSPSASKLRQAKWISTRSLRV